MEQGSTNTFFKKYWWVLLVLIISAIIIVLVIVNPPKKRGQGTGRNNEPAENQNNSSREEKNGWETKTFYPNTEDAPTLDLKWSGTLDPTKATRYTPYGLWESLSEIDGKLAYEPAPEMQFYIKTDAADFLAVAPGVVVVNEVDRTKSSGIGLVTIRYGKNYSVTYFHIIPDKNLKVGQKVEAGDKIGLMEKRQHEQWGKETWWEISVTKYNPKTGYVRSSPPYDYFNTQSKAILDEIAKNSKEGIKIGKGPNAWTITEGCSWVKYTKVPEWWVDFGRLGYKPAGAINQKEEEFVKALNSNWYPVEGGRIVGPTDQCR